MNEWEAKYQALLAGIDNPEYIKNAEKLVQSAIDLSATSGQPFESTFWAMLKVVGLVQSITTLRNLRSLGDE